MVFWNDKTEPDIVEIMEQRRPSNTDAVRAAHRKSVSDRQLTGASNLTVKQSIIPIALVTTLFFLWGFAYGLLDTLNAKFQTSLNITAGMAGGLQGAYFGAYFIGPLTYSGWVVRKFGYRWTFILGLCIYGVGALMFWPSAVKRSFVGFCLSLFIVGSGLSTLETAANPFIATCGPPRLSEFRLVLSQSFQAVGSVMAPLLAARVFFTEDDPHNLDNVQWTYLGIAAFVFLLAVVFYFAPLPEVTDADMALQGEESSGLTGYVQKPIHKQYKLLYGVLAQFCYVGAQVAVAANFIKYAHESANLDHSAASDRFAIGQGVFAIGRFVASGLTMFIKPRLILLAFMAGATFFVCFAIGFKGEAGVAFLTVTMFFESCIFPLIFTLAIRGLGPHTKRGSSWIVASISGGAFFPAMCGLLADRAGYHISMVVPLIGFVVAAGFPIYLNLFCRKELDGFRETKIGYGSDQALDAERRKQDIEGEEGGEDKASANHFEDGNPERHFEGPNHEYKDKL